MKQKLTGLIAGLVFYGLSASLVHAVPIAAITSFTGGNDIYLGGSDLPRTVGWNFTVNNSISVTSLGFWDDSQDGLATAHDIGLWTDAGALLSSTTIQAGLGSVLIGDFRYESIAQVLLAPGDYVIGANIPRDADNYKYGPSSVTTAADISFGNGIRSPSNSGFAFPSLDINSGRIGPNFQFESVPEPTTLALMGLGLAGIGWKRRKAA